MHKQNLAVRIILVVFAAAVMACSGGTKKSADTVIKSEPVVMKVSITGMFCTGCEETIQSRVGELEGIKSVKASYKEGEAMIEFYPDKVDTASIRKRIDGSGYHTDKFFVQ